MCGIFSWYFVIVSIVSSTLLAGIQIVTFIHNVNKTAYYSQCCLNPNWRHIPLIWVAICMVCSINQRNSIHFYRLQKYFHFSMIFITITSFECFCVFCVAFNFILIISFMVFSRRELNRMEKCVLFKQFNCMLMYAISRSISLVEHMNAE